MGEKKEEMKGILISSSWEVVEGNFDDVVTCESSYSDDGHQKEDPHPLFLRRPTPSESLPCEITVVFPQLYDIRQVYVRSSARVFEIYSSTTLNPDAADDNHYLCTVRCGIASTQDQLDADSWVHLNNSSTKHQPRFEATAEISDGDPLISITLRLLSIQTRDYIRIDEVYVFADPVESPHHNYSPPQLQTSPGASMLSMFVPTLLHLSKSRIPTNTNTTLQQNTDQHSTHPLHTRTQVLPDMLHNPHQPNILSHSQISQNTYNDSTSAKIQQTLDELVSRVSRIEAFCLRFEENMLNPIINMETRLQRVEHQLETFTKNTHFPRTACTTFSAPDFSCIESESDSLCTATATATAGNANPATLKSESTKKDDSRPQQLSTPMSDVYPQSSTSASQLLPCLVISAPEFSCMDEEEGTNSPEQVKDSPKILKKPMSIDHALASALAEFVTSTITKPSDHTVTVDETEIVSEAEIRGSTCLSASSTALARQLECTKMIEETENAALVHSDDHQLSLAPIDGGNTSSNDTMVTEKAHLADISGSEETTKTFCGNSHVPSEGGSKLPHSSYVDTFGESGSESSITGIECTESDNDAGQDYVTDIRDSVIDTAILKDAESYAGLKDIIELPTPAKVDFSVTLLDVSFSSLTTSSGKSSLESLLVDIPDLECETPPVRENVASSLSEQYDLVVIEDKPRDVDTASADNMLLYVDDCDSVYMVDDSDSSNRNNQDVCGSLI